MVPFPIEWHIVISPHRQAGSPITFCSAASFSLRGCRVPSKALFTAKHLTVFGSLPNCSFKTVKKRLVHLSFIFVFYGCNATGLTLPALYYQPRIAGEKRVFSHFQSVTSSGTFWLCFLIFDGRAYPHIDNFLNLPII